MIKSQPRKGTTALTEAVFRVEPHFHLNRFYCSSSHAYIWLHSAFLFWQEPQKAWSNSWGNQWEFDWSHRKPWRELQEIKVWSQTFKNSFLSMCHWPFLWLANAVWLPWVMLPYGQGMKFGPNTLTLRRKQWTCLGPWLWAGPWKGAWIQLSPTSGFLPIHRSRHRMG